MEQRIAQQGLLVQRLVESSNQAQLHLNTVRAQVAVVQARLVADHVAQGKAMDRLQRIALDSYMTDTMNSSTLTLFEYGDGSSLLARQEYTRVATANIGAAIDAVDVDEQRTQAAEVRLRAAEVQAKEDVQRLATQRQSAQTALDRDNVLLTEAKSNLQSLLATIAEQYEASEEAEEQKMAEQAAARAALQAQQAASARSVSPTVSPSPAPGNYSNPLQGIADLVPERIDQGVDYSGSGPISALGNGVVLSTVNSGWPGGTFISYRLTDGPAAGLVVYAAEDIEPMVTVGQVVTSSTTLGTVYEGPDGIETGWADPSGDGDTMAMDAGQFSGSNSTAFGANFSALLASVGAPPGVLQNDPPTGTLPADWPSW